MRIVAALPALLLWIAAPVSGAAQDSFPSRPITIISPFSPGTPQDVINRAIGEAMAKDLGQSIIVENRPGAAATLGAANMAATARPDGYTIAGIGTTIVTVPQMQKVAYDPMKDFTYIAQLTAFPVGVTIRADSPHKTWADLIAYAKANPGSVTYGSPGAGSGAHLGMELVLKNAGVTMTHIPHQGAMPIIAAVLGGHVVLQVSGMEWKPHVEQGDMRLLMMLSNKRHPTFPDVPSIGDFGFSMDLEPSGGFAGPKGMDPAVVRRLHDALKKAAEDPVVQAYYNKFDINYRYVSGPDFAAFLEQYGRRMKPIIEELGLQVKN